RSARLPRQRRRVVPHRPGDLGRRRLHRGPHDGRLPARHGLGRRAAGGRVTAPERIMYLARRHPRFATREEWVPRWRAHWELAAAQPESATVRRYIQSEVLVDDSPRPHDGIGSSDYVSLEARLRNRSSERYHAIMRADELEVFDRPIIECAFF